MLAGMTSGSDLLTQARTYLAEQSGVQQQQIGEFEVTRPTPNLDECNRAAAGEIVRPKQWDLSPIDPWAFDPTEPPGRPLPPDPPPANTTAPVVTVVTDLVVGSMVVVSPGSWSGNPTYARQWRRGATAVGTGATSYALAAGDVGAMISCDVTATNAGGSASAPSNAVGPILAV